MNMPAIGQTFIDQSRTYLSAEYLPKIRRCIQELSDEDLWWRPNAQSNSVGNLLLHLTGNIRQWVVAGIADEADTRQRQKEFDAEGGAGRRELVERLEGALREVNQVLTDLGADSLLERRRIQGEEVSVLEALYHVVEHFAMHTGQIIYITKLRTGVDLNFYDVRGGTARPNW